MPPPYAPVSQLAGGSAWYGAVSLGLTYGAQNIARTNGGQEQRFTIIPLPVQPVDELTMQARADAIASTYSGLLMQAVDLYRLTVERNGFMAGILATMAHGFLGLPHTWKGDPEMVAALMDVRDHGGNLLTPGDYRRMHPENECAKIFSDGTGLGIGLGQYLLMCWRCDGVEWLRDMVEDPSDDAPPEEMDARRARVSALQLMARLGDRNLHEVQHAREVVKRREESMRARTTGAEHEIETCKRCGARRDQRPVTMNPDGTATITRELYQLRWRDPRWLWRNTLTLQWYYTGRQGMIPITPGDGEWFFFQTVPDQDTWVHGPWALGTEAAIFTRDARYDMQAISATCAPAHVFQFKGPADPRTRADVDKQADNLRFQNKLTLPGEVSHEIHSATGGDGGYVGTADRITAWAQTQWEVYVTGIQQGTQNGTGFANNGVLQRVSRERRRFYAGSWIRQICAQGLVWWARGNFGSRPAPIGDIDTRSPEDRLAESKADTEEGIAVKGLVEGYAAAGYELDPAYLEERAQAKGLRVRPKAGGHPAAKIVLGVDGVNAATLGFEARAALGLPTFSEARASQVASGDARDMATLAALMDAAKGAAAPGQPAPPAAPLAGPPGGATPPHPPDARIERDEEQDDSDEDEDEDDDEARAKLAADYTAAALDRCPFHGRTHACPRCGVRREYRLDPATRTPVMAWRAIRAERPSPSVSAGPASASADAGPPQG